MSRLLIQQYEMGPLNNFLYLLGDPETKEMAIVDPAWDVEYLCREAKQMGYKISSVFLTHAHPDHVNGLDKLLSIHPVPVFISKDEYPPLRPHVHGLIDVTSKDKLQIGKISFDILHTPGHTPGCLCFLAQGNIITGDTLFIDGCGRCDLIGGDATVMYNSLYHTLMKLPDETVVYPGHNYGPTPTDTFGHQNETNPYLQCRNIKEFLVERMGL